MHKLKALLRRRNHSDDDLFAETTSTTRIRLPHARKSLESLRGPTTMENFRYSSHGSYSRRDKHAAEPQPDTNRPAGDSISHPPMNKDRCVGEQTKPRPRYSPPERSSELGRRVLKGLERDRHKSGCSTSQVATAERSRDARAETSGKKEYDPVDRPGQNESALSELPDDQNTCVLTEETNGPVAENSNSQTVKEHIPERITNNTDTDTTKSYAQAVTHETICSHVHEITEEHVYREIHNHDVYHRIQPVYDVEILPARHFVLDPDGGLVEVSEDDLPDCTGLNEKWYVGKKVPRVVPSSSKDEEESPMDPIEGNGD
ncbi:hypothetical protein F4804DRAFT_260798 [Jackrogersella minutella]|nr:hypothetical protein F4804DRAFT_260798 [Jackrogersella minutella]